MSDLLSRGIDEVIGAAELEKALDSSGKLRLKYGVDPSSPDIHLGHTVTLRKLKQFQDLGHTVIFLIGDYTALIGDPSGRNKTRPTLSAQEIEHNAKTYLDQVSQILDVDKAEIRRNSEWYGGLAFADLLSLVGNFTVAQLIEREDFRKRLKEGIDVGLQEILYPVMQAYDSVQLKADVEFGGTDQRFNMLAGRALQKKLGQRPQQIVMAKLLVGTDGTNKMSKSLGNYVGITESPADIFGKIMSIPDELIASYYELCTDVPLDVIETVVQDIAAGANPRDTKASLAREIVSLYHGDKAAEAAEAAFNKQFRDKELPEDIPLIEVTKSTWDPVELLTGLKLTDSKSEARRLIDQGGVRLGEKVVSQAEIIIKTDEVLQVGKRRFVRLKVK